MENQQPTLIKAFPAAESRKRVPREPSLRRGSIRRNRSPALRHVCETASFTAHSRFRRAAPDPRSYFGPPNSVIAVIMSSPALRSSTEWVLAGPTRSMKGNSSCKSADLSARAVTCQRSTGLSQPNSPLRRGRQHLRGGRSGHGQTGGGRRRRRTLRRPSRAIVCCLHLDAGQCRRGTQNSTGDPDRLFTVEFSRSRIRLVMCSRKTLDDGTLDHVAAGDPGVV